MSRPFGVDRHITAKFLALSLFVTLALAGMACSEKSPSSETSAASATESSSKAGEPVEPDEAVDRCVEAYEHLFGPLGCVPGLVSSERIQVACEGYAAWAARGETCGSGALGSFYACLNAIPCDKLEKDEDTELAEYPIEYDKCTEQFARDMNECIDNRAEKTK